MDTCVKTSFPNRLKELRVEKKVNQAQLAEDLKIGRASISNYEIGSRLPDADVVVALADYFGVSTDYLLGRTSLRTGTTESADEQIVNLGKRAVSLSPSRKDELYKMLSYISQMLDVDMRREEDCSVFNVYTTVMGFLRKLDEVIDGYISMFFAERLDEKDDSDGINVTENLIGFKQMVNDVRESAMLTGDMISFTLNTDLVHCVSGESSAVSSLRREFYDMISPIIGETKILTPADIVAKRIELEKQSGGIEHAGKT